MITVFFNSYMIVTVNRKTLLNLPVGFLQPHVTACYCICTRYNANSKMVSQQLCHVVSHHKL